MTTPRQDKIAFLHDRVRKLSVRLRDLEQQEKEETSIPLLRKQVGRCFRYRNSYSCAQEKDKWYVYARILSFDEKAMTFNTIEFQDKSDKCVEIAYEKRYNFEGESHFSRSSWEPVQLAEYHRARKRLFKFLNSSLGTGRIE